MAIYFTPDTAIDVADAAVRKFDLGGTVEIWSGARPAIPGGPVTTQVLLATFILPAPGFGATADVVGQNYVQAVGNIPANSATPSALGNAGWARAKDLSGVVVFDGNVGNAASTAYARLTNLALNPAVDVSMTGHTYRQPKQ